MYDNDIRQDIKAYYDIYWGINSVYEHWAKRRGLTINSLFTLYVIHETPDPCTSKLLCEKLLLPKQTINTILDFFEKKGYLTRKTAVNDKRSKHIILTTTGQQYADLLFSELLAFEQKAFENMSPAERDGMIKGSAAFYHNLKQILDTI